MGLSRVCLFPFPLLPPKSGLPGLALGLWRKSHLPPCLRQSSLHSVLNSIARGVLPMHSIDMLSGAQYLSAVPINTGCMLFLPPRMLSKFY